MEEPRLAMVEVQVGVGMTASCKAVGRFSKKWDVISVGFPCSPRDAPRSRIPLSA